MQDKTATKKQQNENFLRFGIINTKDKKHNIMNNHQEFLNFNGNKIIFLSKDGTYWIALKPILDSLNLDADRYIRSTKKDPFFMGCTSNLTVQVSKNGILQGRKMVCLQEKCLKPILEALNINANMSLKSLKKHPILRHERSNLTINVHQKSINRGRRITCLPEKYIYGRICSLVEVMN